MLDSTPITTEKTLGAAAAEQSTSKHNLIADDGCNLFNSICFVPPKPETVLIGSHQQHFQEHI